MTNFYNFVGVVIFIVVVLYVLSELKKSKTNKELPYQANKYLLTKGELQFYHVLKQIASEKALEVHSKVRMWDLVHVPKDTELKLMFENKVRAKHIDFVLTKYSDSEIVLLIELDDKSHERKSRQESDEFKDDVIKAAGHKLLRIKTQKVYNADAIKKDIDELIE